MSAALQIHPVTPDRWEDMVDLFARRGPVAKEDFTANGVRYPAGTLLIDRADNLADFATKYHLTVRGLDPKPNVATAVLKEVRVGLYKPWTASMDEGWTRWLLEQYDFNMKNVDNKTIKAGNLNAAFDAIRLFTEAIAAGKIRLMGRRDARDDASLIPRTEAQAAGRPGIDVFSGTLEIYRGGQAVRRYEDVTCHGGDVAKLAKPARNGRRLASAPDISGEWRSVVTSASTAKAAELRRIAPTLCGSVIWSSTTTRPFSGSSEMSSGASGSASSSTP